MQYREVVKNGKRIHYFKIGKFQFQFENSDFKTGAVEFLDEKLKLEMREMIQKQIFEKQYEGEEDFIKLRVTKDNKVIFNHAISIQVGIEKNEKGNFKLQKPHRFKVETEDFYKIMSAVRANNICQKIDLLNLVSKDTNLKKIGRGYSGHSPFRTERTASFYVYPESNSYYDFGDNSGGNIINYVMKRNDMKYRQALEVLEDMIEQGQYALYEAQDYEVAKSKFDIESLKKVMNIYADTAKIDYEDESQNLAVTFLESDRKLSRETIENFGLTYVTPTIIPKLKQVKDDQIVEKFRELGLINEKNMFKQEGRVGIPLRTADGNCVGINGRSIVSNEKYPKYLVTPTTDIFKKSDVLFNFHQAKQYSENGVVILTEGAFDVMRCHEMGFKNSVGLLGSSLSETQLELLKSLNSTVVLALDSDSAGVKATKKITRKFEEIQIPFAIFEIKNGKDLDEVLQIPTEYNQFCNFINSKLEQESEVFHSIDTQKFSQQANLFAQKNKSYFEME